MKSAAAGFLFLALSIAPAFSQSDAPPVSEVHASAKSLGNGRQYVRTLGLRAGRYEIRTATMLDLIRIAYSYDMDKILGGPSWLELDRFDITIQMPQDTAPEAQKTMLQAVLADRFKLSVRKEDKPLPTFALRQGKKPLLKEADGNGAGGCRPQSGPSNPGPGGGPMIMLSGAMVGGSSGSTPVPIRIGADGMLTWECRNISMASFAGNMRNMIGANLGLNPILDETGLEGIWNFDLKYTAFSMANSPTGKLTLQDAVDKELGLKLEPKTVPTPVLVVEKAEKTPTPNPPGIEQVLPPVKIPTEFDVASLKPSDPGGRGGRIQTLPGGRFTAEGMPLRTLIMRGFNTTNEDSIVGMPKFVTDRYDVMAKAPAPEPGMPPLESDDMGPMILSLLKNRFKLEYHTEDREVSAYALVATKPKLKKANPENRSYCKPRPSSPGTPSGSNEFACQNITMAQFVDELPGVAPTYLIQGMYWPVVDKTGLEGAWDFSFTFSFSATMMAGGRIQMPMRAAVDSGGGGGGGGGAGGAAAATPTAEDPTGGLTLFEALEKQLGLKMELQKRTAKVIVIDHMEQKPTEN